MSERDQAECPDDIPRSASSLANWPRMVLWGLLVGGLDLVLGAFDLTPALQGLDPATTLRGFARLFASAAIFGVSVAGILAYEIRRARITGTRLSVSEVLTFLAACIALNWVGQWVLGL